jgi:type IV pilus assembly protein PilF
MARPSIACAACGARNKPGWDFCARCGESLAGAAAEPTAKPQASSSAAKPSAGASSPWPILAAILALAVGGWVSWKMFGTAEPPATLGADIFKQPSASEAVARGPVVQSAAAKAIAESERLVRAGDRAGALTVLRTALEADAGSAQLHVALADLLTAPEERDEALSHLSRAADAGGPSFRRAYAAALDRAGRASDAITEYQRAIAEGPGQREAEDQLGELLYREKRYADAAVYLERRAAHDPDDVAVQQRLAAALQQAGNGARAEEMYRSILDRAPGAAVTRTLLADLLIKKGETEQGVQLLREGVSTSPDSPLGHRGLASVLDQTGRQQEAAREYREYLRLAPNAPDAKQIEARAQALEGATPAPPAAS